MRTREQSDATRVDHTAPLWPMYVPIQSPVAPSRSIGIPSIFGVRITRCLISARTFGSAKQIEAAVLELRRKGKVHNRAGVARAC